MTTFYRFAGLVAWLALVAASGVAAGQSVELPPREQFHLFVLAGQSNMAGRGKVEPQDRQPHPRVLVLTQEGTWAPAVDPLHFDKPNIVGVGLGRTFGIEMAGADPRITVGLIPCAVGGSPIASWEPGGFHSQTNTHPWDDALRRIAPALESGVLKGILWHQGESDARQGLEKVYEQKLHDLVARFRRELEAPQLPFVVGQLGQFPERPWDDAVRTVDAAHRALPDKVPHTAFVSAEGLSHKGDQVHFDAKSYRELGRRYARAYRHLVPPRFSLATFSADVTIPLNHRCMGVLPTKSKKIVDPLYAHGFVLLGGERPIVLCAVDWCEIRNGAYDQWREALAEAAGTTRERVLVSSLHQHDAPVTDRGAAQLLASVELPGELYDESFHDQTVQRVAAALRDGLAQAVPVTHLGLGQARVERIASNRRVVYPDGRVTFGRGSRSGADAFHRDQPEGLIDPFLKTLSFFNGEQPVLALHAYATHPMSYYGRGEVTSDFVGLARERRQRDDQSVRQIYVSGCSGDVTAGKFNDGSHDARLALVDRLYQAMVAAWEETRRVPLEQVEFRSTQFELEFHPAPKLTAESLEATLRDTEQTVERRILAAMGLSSRRRVAAGQPIDLPVVDFGPAQVVLFPGEAFVGYQLMAQEMRPDSFVVSIGYGECWPGYIPTRSAFEDNFGDSWLWVAPGSQARIRAALEKVLPAP